MQLQMKIGGFCCKLRIWRSNPRLNECHILGFFGKPRNFFSHVCASLNAHRTFIPIRHLSPFGVNKAGWKSTIFGETSVSTNSRLKRQRWPRWMLVEEVWRDDRRQERHQSLFTFCCRSGFTHSLPVTFIWVGFKSFQSFQSCGLYKCTTSLLAAFIWVGFKSCQSLLILWLCIISAGSMDLGRI